MRKPLLLGFGVAQQIIFTRSLSTYLHAGISLREALELLTQSARNEAYLLERLTYGIVEGRTLSQSMRDFPRVFTSFSVTLIEIGEESGTMREALGHVAETLEKQRALSRKVLGALAYPALVIFITLGICSFLILYAFPKIVPLFRGFGTELPFTTRTLIALSDIGAKHGIALLSGVAILCVAAVFLLKNPTVRRVTERVVLKTPGIGAMVSAFQLTHTSRTLSVLLTSGVPIIRALELASVSKIQIYADAMHSCRTLVLEGEKLSHALGMHTHCFPRTCVQLIAAGERTGTLPAMFQVLEKHYENEFDTASNHLTAFVEPALMILMGFLVGFIALAIITPVYQITQGMHG